MAKVILGPNGRPISSDFRPPGLIAPPNNQNWYHWAYQWMGYTFNPDTISTYEYERMYDTDEMVFSGCEFLIQSCLARLGDYTHVNDRIQDFVQQNLTKMEGGFITRAAEMLTSLIYGFSCTEKIWDIRDGMVWIRDLQTLHPATCTIDMFREGPDKNKLRVVYQFLHGWLQAELTPDKVIYYPHKGNFRQLYGKSRLKRAYKSWFIKDVLLKCWGLCLERYGTPYTVAKTDMNGTIVDPNGRRISSHEWLGEVLDSMGSKGSLIVDSKTEVDVKYGPRGMGQDFESAIAALNRAIHMAIGLPSLIADNGKTGSYSLGEQHFDNFVLILESILHEFTEIVIEQLIKPLIEYNFGKQDDYGDFQREDFSAADQNMMSQTLVNLNSAQIFKPELLEDMNWAREKIGMPLLDEEDLTPSQPLATPPIRPDMPVKVATSFSWAGKKRRRELRKAHTFSERRTQLDRELAMALRARLTA